MWGYGHRTEVFRSKSEDYGYDQGDEGVTYLKLLNGQPEMGGTSE